MKAKSAKELSTRLEMVRTHLHDQLDMVIVLEAKAKRTKTPKRIVDELSMLRSELENMVHAGRIDNLQAVLAEIPAGTFKEEL